MKTKEEELLDEIEKVRQQNNKHWMDILRLAFKTKPKESKELMKKIVGLDKKITELAAELSEEEE